MLRNILLLALLAYCSVAVPVLTTQTLVINPELTVSCSTQTENDKKLQFSGKCFPNSELAVSKMGTIKLKGKQMKSWKALCSTACVRKPNCLGFTIPSRKTNACTLLGGVGCQSLTQVVSPRATNKNNLVTLQSDCWIPKTGVPTTRPTESPVARCELPEGSPYKSTFDSMEGRSTGYDYFHEVFAEKRLCEYMRLSGSSTFRKIEDFPCGEDACLRWCRYDDSCGYSAFSAVERTCMKSTYMELTDDKASFLPFHTADTKVWMRNSKGLRPLYFSGQCSAESPSACKVEAPECAWNKGKRGYNDQNAGGSANGYCGRVKCLL